MGFLDRLLGRDDGSEQYRRPAPAQRPRSEDEIAIERYRYLLRTAPPETIEQVHAEAFAKLTPEQRRQVYDELVNGPDRPTGDDPASLARAATRSEIRQPGTLERRLGGLGGGGGYGGGPSFGSMLGGSLLGSLAGYVIGSALVSAFMPPIGFEGMDGGGYDGADGGGYDGGGGYDAGGFDGGGGLGGGGDFGGGGGGDFGGGGF